MIPKIIHQTWKDNKIPDNWVNAVESCKLNGYKYILWTDKTMDEFVKVASSHEDIRDLEKFELI